MALTRSMGARKDSTRGTTPIEVRKATAAYWSNPGVVAGGPTTLVTGTAGMAYSIGGVAQFVTSRGQSDGYHVFTNDGAATIVCPAAPGSGLSRWDVIWVSHPAAGENSDTTSAPIFGVSSSAIPASSNPAVPSVPTGALELARNLMTSAAVTTLTVPGNTIAQTAAVAASRVSAGQPAYSPAAFTANWGNYGSTWQTAGWWKDPNGRVWLQGRIGRPGSSFTGIPGTLLTLPAPACPMMDTSIDVLSFAGSIDSRQLQILSSGAVQLQDSATWTSGQSWISLDGLSFQGSV